MAPANWLNRTVMNGSVQDKLPPEGWVVSGAPHVDGHDHLKAPKCHLVPLLCLLRKDNKCGVNAERMRCKMHAAVLLLLRSTWCIFGRGRVPVVCGSSASGRQVKGVWWQNAWCVAYFPGFDLPWIRRCEENEDELGAPRQEKSKKTRLTDGY